MKKICQVICVSALFVCTRIYAQSPASDKSWLINSAKSDEFNTYGATPNPHPFPNGVYYVPNNDLFPYHWFTNRIDNIFIRDNDIAVLKVVNDNYDPDGAGAQPSRPYSAAAFQTAADYQYGYFEARIKFPKGNGFHPCFWLWDGQDSQCWFYEMDIAEPYGALLEQCTSIGTNVHIKHPSSPPVSCASAYNLSVDAGQDITGLPDLSANWHTYGFEWSPNRLVWYFDNQIIRTITNPALIPVQKPLKLIISTGVDYMLSNVTTMEMQIDYFKHYTRKTDCSTVVNVNNFDFTNATNFAIKKSYSLGNSTVGSGVNTTLRATDFIELRSNFEVPVNTTFEAKTSLCND